MFLEFNDVLVRGEREELFKRCFSRCYAAVKVSYEYEKARILEGMGKAGAPNNDRRAPPRRDPRGRSGASGRVQTVSQLDLPVRHPSSRSSDDP